MKAQVTTWLAAVAASITLAAVGAWVFPGLPWDGVGGFALVFGSVAGCVIATSATAPSARPRALVWLALPLAVIAGAAALGDRAYGLGGALAVNAALLVGGGLGGAVIGALIEDAGHLSVVAYVTTLADLYSVLSPKGVSAQIAAHKPTLALLAISWPIPASDVIAPVLGVGDITMTALYLVAVRKFGLPLRRTLAAFVLAYAAVFASLVATQRALPALPFLAVAFVAANPRVLKIRPQDRRQALIGLGVTTALFLAALARS